MKVHIVGPYYGYSYSVSKSLEKAARILGWQVEITDPRSAARHNQNWVPEILNSNPDFFLCASVEGWHRAFQASANLAPRVLWLREEVRRDQISSYVDEVKDFYNHIFYFEPSGQKIIEERAGVKTHFLPLAFDPSVHRRVKCERDLDIVFIGSLTSPEGSHYKTREIGLDLISKSGLRLTTFSSWDPIENSRTYSRAKITWNLGSWWPDFGPPEELRSVGYQNRVFEGIASASLVFTHKVTEGRVFHPNQHLVEYDSSNMIDLLRSHIEDPKRSREMAESAYKFARRSHTYKSRLEKIGEVLNGSV